ncbi:hypothetical protein Tco_1292281 [Tanacetum coccineum]
MIHDLRTSYGVAFWETTGKGEGEGKGKAVVTEEQVANSAGQSVYEEMILMISLDLQQRNESGTESGAPIVTKFKGNSSRLPVHSGVSIPVSDLRKCSEIILIAREEFDSTIPDPSHHTVTSAPPVIDPFIDVTSSEPSLLVTPPLINTEATTITTSLPEITPFIALQLRVARLEQEMSEVKKTDVLASIRSQVPYGWRDNSFRKRKLDDALLKVLERHTYDLIEKLLCVPGPRVCQESGIEKRLRRRL